MPIHPPNPRPPFNIVRCGTVTPAVRDLERSRRFYADALGLLVAEQSGGALFLRGLEESWHHSIALVEGPAPACLGLGFKVASADDLEQAAAFFRRRGLPAAWAERPFQGQVLQTRDPHGTPLEFYAEMQPASRALQRFGEYRGAQIMRIDHVNCFAPDVQAAYDFYAGELGFRPTEYTETEEPEPRLWAAWLHRKGNVHDLALTSGAGPRLHHIGVWVPTAMNIIHACDVLATTGYLGALERGPGRHGISNAFFLYLRDPDGHRVELFASDYQTVDPDFRPIGWKLHDAQRQTLWGQPAPRSWFEEGTPFAGADVRAPALDAQPVVAH